MNRSQKWILGITLLVSAAMAYFLQDIILSLLFEPLSYVWYALTLLYYSIAQVIVWFVLMVSVALVAFGSLYGEFRLAGSMKVESVPVSGPIEKLAGQISSGDEGIYNKWLVANRLGKLAQSIFQRRSGHEGSSNSTLDIGVPGAPAEVKSYLDAGLQSTFADFPRRRWFSPRPQTPFDLDIEEVIAYLESKMEEHQ